MFLVLYYYFIQRHLLDIFFSIRKRNTCLKWSSSKIKTDDALLHTILFYVIDGALVHSILVKSETQQIF